MTTETTGLDKNYFVFNTKNKKRKIEEIRLEGTTSPLPLKNKYEPLANADEDAEIMEENDNAMEDSEEVNQAETSKKSENVSQKTKYKPPPIVLRCAIHDKEHKNVRNAISLHVKKGYHLKLSKDRASLFIHDNDEYVMYLSKLQAQEDIPYHTYTTKENKTHAFVLTGLYGELDLEEVKDELRVKYEIPVENIFKMKGTYIPKYLVTTDQKITLKTLNTHVRYIIHTKIAWERYYNTKRIIQCHRCQEWGHATTNCRAEPACLKCGEAHLTYQCTKPKENPPKCANCQGEHTANNTECPVYSKILEGLTKKSAGQRTYGKYVHQSSEFPGLAPPRTKPAPPPDTNAWEERRKRTQPQSQQQTQIHTEADTNDMDELRNEIAKLNTLIDVKKYLTLIKQLNQTLTNCNTESQKFQAFLKFNQQLDG